jgi:putative flippase GtrA
LGEVGAALIDVRTRVQFLKYVLVGIVSNLLLYSAYLSLTTFGVGHKSAMTLLYFFGVFLTFIVNRSWTFKHLGIFHTVFVRYVAVCVLGYLLNFMLLWLGVDYLHFPHQGVQALAIVSIAAIVFLMHKYWVFLQVMGKEKI